MAFQNGNIMEPRRDNSGDQQKFLGTRIALALVASGVVLFPMLAGKSVDPNHAMLFWLVSPVLVTTGTCGYAWHYLRLAQRGALRRAWAEGAHDLAADTRYITVLLAIAYLVGFFFDPNG